MQNSTSSQTAKSKTAFKIIPFALLGIAVIVAGFLTVRKFFASGDSQVVITPYNVESGDITTVISGTGTVEPIEQYDIASIARGDVIADYITVGQQVTEGDLLYEVDSTEAQNSIEKSRIALQKQQLAYDETVNNIENLTVRASISGTITNMYVQNGDNLQNNGRVCDIVNSTTLSITLPFLVDDAKNIHQGQAATITLDATNEIITGKVKRVTTGSYATATGAIVSDVEIIFHNPGAIKVGGTATALVGNYACNQAAEIAYGDQITVLAKTSGEVSELELSVGDKVNQGDILLKLINSSTTMNAQSGQLSIRDAELALDNQIKALEDYMITSPISGTIIEKTYKAGDTLDGNKSSMAIVADMSKLLFTMNIDELDIKSLAVGQEVIVTADALPDQTFTGYINNISIIGTSGSGVTTYPVEVIIPEYEGLLPGMNVNADIISEQATNVLKIPLAALSRGNLVLVTEEYAESIGAVKMENRRGNRTDSDKRKPDEASSEANTERPSPPDGEMPEMPADDDKVMIVDMPNTPEGYVWIRVTIGMSDDDYVEVTSGLTEGAQVYVVTTKQEAQAANNTSGMGAMGGMGGMPGMSGGMGAMPGGMGGGMPSGAMGGNRSAGGMSGNRSAGGGIR